MSTDNLISIAALTVSTLSLVYSFIIGHRQKSLIALDEQIKLQELADRQQRERDSMAACVEARHIRTGSKTHALRISNTGKATARNVRYIVLDEEIARFFWHKKEPFEFLERGSSYDEVIVTFNGFPPKVLIQTFWDDESGENRMRENLVSF